MKQIRVANAALNPNQIITITWIFQNASWRTEFFARVNPTPPKWVRGMPIFELADIHACDGEILYAIPELWLLLLAQRFPP